MDIGHYPQAATTYHEKGRVLSMSDDVTPCTHDDTAVYIRPIGAENSERTPIRVASVKTCMHLTTVCKLCVRYWAVDYDIDFNATIAGQRLLADRHRLDHY
jgi:hypothetical protein